MPQERLLDGVTEQAFQQLGIAKRTARENRVELAPNG
jgi:hypothetical protein